MTWIQTYEGTAFDLLDPNPDDIRILDIAHALSNQCRFAGHTKEFYSVAQHSLITALNCPPGLGLYGLLHDASEAYLCDLSTPLKAMLPRYREIEKNLQIAINRRFDLEDQIPAEVKEIDRRVLATEKRDIMGPEPRPWLEGVEPFKEKIVPMNPSDSKSLFLYCYEKTSSATIH